MPQIHPQARTTPAVRAEIARSTESSSVVAKRYGVVSAQTSPHSGADRHRQRWLGEFEQWG